MTFYQFLVHAALVVWTLLGLGMLIGLVVAGPRLLRTMAEIDEMSEVVRTRALPALEETQAVLDQLSRITTTLADDVEVVDRTIVRAADSVDRMVDLTEERVAEVNALLTVALEEAEDTFVSVGGLLRAVLPGRRRGLARWLPGGKRRRFG